MHSLSSRTIRSSCKVASCAEILPNPTSSTVFPPICIATSGVDASSSTEAYFFLKPSRNETGSSMGLVGRTKDPAVEEED